ncbi:methyltransferase type 11 [Desulfurococcus amylolyticus 1221n]|uniref:Methyltransferase type 11 n=1 Tax=Desulfurococcus amylolyticus (strain DSM 18924 / JCM 16383 / VKM B-2413 / 1221n) TaxID=490899 RepID=B8D6A3_DESA1|nr:tRNA (adenine-N1)-methyltransferase [Desulfurococcus amylolyticus]ACL11634.1 methyltransferase type 11 [Desulfurococcus amylolyticus 1221n]
MSAGDIISENDDVLIVFDEKRRFIVKARKEGVLGTDKGVVRLSDLIGKPYGSIVKTSRGIEVLILKPLPFDYSLLVQRVTQVIYPKDAGLMIYLSGIKPGSKIGEAGVGSGALTVMLASIIGDSGLLYGFDISEKSLENTKTRLERVDLINRVRLLKHDIREPVSLGETLDSFFLDIPDPWNAVNTVAGLIKTSGTLLVYVPTINQVEKTVLKLQESGCFTDIHSYEVLLREYKVDRDAVRPFTRMVGHTGYIIFARRIKCNLGT